MKILKIKLILLVTLTVIRIISINVQEPEDYSNVNSAVSQITEVLKY